jgi:hypothetical protein
MPKAQTLMDWSQPSLQPDFLVGVFWGFYRTPEDKQSCRRSAPRSCVAEGISQTRGVAR